MKTLFKFATVTGWIFCAMAPAHAAKTPAPLPTNVVDNFSIQLTLTTQGATTTNHTGLVVSKVNTSTIATKAVITAIGDSLGVNFSSSAQLQAIKPLTYTTNSSTNTVGNKTTITTVIVGANTETGVVVLDRGVVTKVPAGMFTFIETNAAAVSATVATNVDFIEGRTAYNIATFTFTSPALSFSIQGFDVATLTYPKAATGIYIEDALHTLSPAAGTVTMTSVAGTVTGVCQGKFVSAFAKLN